MTNRTVYREDPWEHALRRAREIGEAQGSDASSWVEITGAEHARAIIRGADEDIDSEIMDTLPSAPTGEYANDYSPADLARDLGTDDDDSMTLWDAYADAFNDRVARNVVSMARGYLSTESEES